MAERDLTSAFSFCRRLWRQYSMTGSFRRATLTTPHAKRCSGYGPAGALIWMNSLLEFSRGGQLLYDKSIGSQAAEGGVALRSARGVSLPGQHLELLRRVRPKWADSHAEHEE